MFPPVRPWRSACLFSGLSVCGVPSQGRLSAGVHHLPQRVRRDSRRKCIFTLLPSVGAAVAFVPCSFVISDEWVTFGLILINRYTIGAEIFKVVIKVFDAEIPTAKHSRRWRTNGCRQRLGGHLSCWFGFVLAVADPRRSALFRRTNRAAHLRQYAFVLSLHGLLLQSCADSAGCESIFFPHFGHGVLRISSITIFIAFW